MAYKNDDEDFFVPSSGMDEVDDTDQSSIPAVTGSKSRKKGNKGGKAKSHVRDGGSFRTDEDDELAVDDLEDLDDDEIL